MKPNFSFFLQAMMEKRTKITGKSLGQIAKKNFFSYFTRMSERGEGGRDLKEDCARTLNRVR